MTNRTANAKAIYTREVSICLRSIDNFTRGGALADYEQVYKDGEALQAVWRGKKTAHITTPAGTDLYMDMNPVEPKIEEGRIVEVVGGDAKICKEIRRQIAEVKDSDNIAEIGIGLNPACMFNGDFEEEKKARGTCHIAMGACGGSVGGPVKASVVASVLQGMKKKKEAA